MEQWRLHLRGPGAVSGHGLVCQLVQDGDEEKNVEGDDKEDHGEDDDNEDHGEDDDDKILNFYVNISPNHGGVKNGI